MKIFGNRPERMGVEETVGDCHNLISTTISFMRPPPATKGAAKVPNRFGAIQNTMVHSSLLANDRLGEIYCIV
jgi:hypothetical protein